jgi:hypothetical protein
MRRITCTFILLILLLAACRESPPTLAPSITAAATLTSTPATASAQLNQPFQLQAGKTAILPEANLSIKFDAVLGDSRCPKTVVCVWSGEVKIALSVSVAGEPPTRVELTTLTVNGQNVALVGAYHIELLQAVDPYPQVPEQKIPFEAYTIPLIVK